MADRTANTQEVIDSQSRVLRWNAGSDLTASWQRSEQTQHFLFHVHDSAQLVADAQRWLCHFSNNHWDTQRSKVTHHPQTAFRAETPTSSVIHQHSIQWFALTIRLPQPVYISVMDGLIPLCCRVLSCPIRTQRISDITDTWSISCQQGSFNSSCALSPQNLFGCYV